MSSGEKEKRQLEATWERNDSEDRKIETEAGQRQVGGEESNTHIKHRWRAY